MSAETAPPCSKEIDTNRNMESGVFDRVLVPLEFEPAKKAELASGRAAEIDPGHWIVISASSLEALRLAARLVGSGGVCLVHATPDIMGTAIYGGIEGTWIPTSDAARLNTEAREHALAVLRKLGNLHCPNADLVVKSDPGRPIDVILEHAKEYLPSAIILSASSRGRPSRMFLGSTADKVIRQALCPVMVVPARAE